MDANRREFLAAAGVAAVAGTRAATRQDRRVDPGATAAWRREFPALDQRVNGHPLAYLDSAATTLRPRAVIDAVARFYETDNANPGAALHTLARRAATRYGAARERVGAFLNAADPSEVVFTKGTTEGINLVAATFASQLAPGDEILLTVAEHYSNLLPWRAVAARSGAAIRLVDIGDDGRLDAVQVAAAISSRTRLIAFSHVSNVLGLVAPAAEICAAARARGVPVLIDAAQSAPHVKLDVRALDCDFLACSSHKMLGPMGVGVLWVRRSWLDRLPPVPTGQQHGPRGRGRQCPVRARGAEVTRPARPTWPARSAWPRRWTCSIGSASTPCAVTMRCSSPTPATASRGSPACACSARSRAAPACRSSPSR